jgi:hypothetical protein
METLTLNLVDSLLEHVLQLYDFHIVSTFEHEVIVLFILNLFVD